MALKRAERRTVILPGTETRFHEEDDQLIIEETADFEPLLRDNAELRKEQAGTRFGEFKNVAQIHPVMWQKLIEEGIAYDSERLKAWLNDPANECWRTLKCKL